MLFNRKFLVKDLKNLFKYILRKSSRLQIISRTLMKNFLPNNSMLLNLNSKFHCLLVSQVSDIQKVFQQKRAKSCETHFSHDQHIIIKESKSHFHKQIKNCFDNFVKAIANWIESENSCRNLFNFLGSRYWRLI